MFTANATAAIKLVMEAFRENEEGYWYGYHSNSHTSLIGVREAAKAGRHCFTSDAEVERWLELAGTDVTPSKSKALKLFAYPAQSNMNGRRLPLNWPQRLRSVKSGQCIYTLLDAAAYVSTSSLDLSDHNSAPDYTALSFNKMFGFPDLGALIVRKAAMAPLRQRSYFGGGTVEVVSCGQENWHISKERALHEQLEDGTLPVHNILALDAALTILKKLFDSQEEVARHTSYLAHEMFEKLCSLRHGIGMQLCQIYKNADSSYVDPTTQGPIIAFNLRNSQGEYISNSEVEKLANIRKIHLRSGGLCNPGGIASSLGLAPWELKRNFSAGHRCGNENDIISGKPTGMLRVSFGAMSSIDDVHAFISFLEEFFIESGYQESRVTDPETTTSDLYVESLNVYPVKSCAGWQIPRDVSWDIRAEGLMWDREWCLVHRGTCKALSQKKFPNMALLRPSLDLVNGLLRVRFHGFLPTGVQHEVSVPLSENPSVYNPDDSMAQNTSEVCGDEVCMKTYADHAIATFFTAAVGTPCTLARFPHSTSAGSLRHAKPRLTGHSPSPSILLSNESPILTISRSSLNRLNEQIKATDGKAAHASVFRANIVLAENPSMDPPGFERPYAEDGWQVLQFDNGVTLDVLGGCRRCQMVCIDQETAEKDEEPFVTLAKTRRRQGKVYFGVHTALAVKHLTQGARVRVGDLARPVFKAREHDATF